MNQFNKDFPSRSVVVSVLIIDADLGMRNFLKKLLAEKFALVETAKSVDDAEQLRSRCHFDLLIVDIGLFNRSGIRWDEAFDEKQRQSDIIFMAGSADIDIAIKALRIGAADFIVKPFLPEQMMTAVERTIDRRLLRCENLMLQRDVAINQSSTIIGSSDAMIAVKQAIEKVAPTDAIVLSDGESGYPLNWSLKEVEKHHITAVVDLYQGNKSAAARELGVSRKTLDRKYKQWYEPSPKINSL